MKKNMCLSRCILLRLFFLLALISIQEAMVTMHGFANGRQGESLLGSNLDDFNNSTIQKNRQRLDIFGGNIDLEGSAFQGNMAILKFSMNPIYDLNDLKVKFIFPKDIDFVLPENRSILLDYSVEKNYVLQGIPNTKKSELTEFEVPIIARKLNIFKIRVFVEALIENKYKISRSYYFQIDSFSGKIKKAIRTQENPSLTSMFHESHIDEIVDTPDLLALVTVTGYFKYEEESGNLQPIRYATAELWEDLLIDVKLGTSYTTSSGYVSFPINFTGTKSLYIKIINETAAAKATNGWGFTYTAVTPTKSVESANSSTWSFGTGWLDSSHQSWEAVDNVVDEYQWIDNRVSYARSQVVINWPWDSWPNSHGNEIHLPDRSVAYWDDSTVYHEYSHCVMYTIYGNSWPSGWGPDPHSVESESSGGFALTEGFPEFMECAVPNNIYNLTGYYCVGGNIETNYWYNCIDEGDMDGDIIEGSIASIFWDIFDPINDDNLEMGFEEIWNILRGYNPNNINDFWNTWNSLYGAGQELWQIYYKYGINKDTNYPSNPTIINSTSHLISQWNNNNTISMNWSGASDNLSGVKGYSILWDSNSGSIPDTAIDATGGSASSQPLTSGIYYFHIRTCDNANNWNPSAVHRGPYWIDIIPPTGSITINNGAASTTSLIVSINISASDLGNSGLSQMRFSNNNSTWSAAEFYSTLKSNWDLSSYGGNSNPGQKTVYAQFKDVAGNWSNSCSDNINYSPLVPDIRTPISNIGFGNVTVGSTSNNTTTIYNDGNATLTVNTITRSSGSAEFTYVGPNVPFNIAAGGWQAVTLRFAPTTAGSKSAVFNVNSNDPDEANITFNVTGTGVTPSVPDIRTPISDIGFGSVTVGSTSNNTTTIYNDGNATLTVNAITRSSGSTEFTYVGPNVPFNIAAGGSQAITLRFAPTTAGSKSAVFNVNSNDPDEANVTFNVTGTGVIPSVPDIRTPISDIGFGNVTVGSTSDKTTTIYNDGNATLTVNAITRSSGSAEFTYVGPAVPFNIAAGGWQAVTLRFAPTTVGSKSAVFNVNSNDPDEVNVTFNVTGTGGATYSIPFNESFLGAVFPVDWTTQNEGTGITNKWLISVSSLAGGAPNEVVCQWQSVNPGTTRLITPPINTVGYATLYLSFKHFLETYASGGVTLKIQTSPDGSTWTDESWTVVTSSSNIGPETINATLTHNLNRSGTYVAFVITGDLYYFNNWYIDDVLISATGFPDIRTPISDIGFGNVTVGSTSNNTTTIYNDGNAMLTVNTITRSSGSAEFTYVGPTVPFNIAAGGSQAITLRFAPTTAGSKSAVFNVNSNDPDEANITFNVTGTGVTPSVPDIRTPISDIGFGSVTVGSTSNNTTAIYNDGNATLTVNTITRSSGSAEFTYVGPTVPFNIAAGGWQAVTLRFAPTTAGSKSAVFNVNSNDPDEASVTFNVTGTGVTPSVPDIRTPISDIGFGSVTVGSTSDKTTTIYNDGNATLTVNTITRSSGSAEFTYVGPNVPFNIAAGGWQAVTLRFAPTTVGSKSAVFNVNSNDPDEVNVTFNVTGTATGISLPEAVDNSLLDIMTGGNANWYGQALVWYFGNDAAKSGPISDLQSSWMQTSVIGPGTLSFYWKVSSEAYFDYLRFYIDNIEQTGAISGEVDWEQKTYSIPAGTHTIKWVYTKDVSLSYGMDAGLVDKVEFMMLGAANIYIFDGHDFNGDGSSEVSVWRPSNGYWFVRNGTNRQWGTSGDIPANGDYDGDGTTDIAVWRPSGGYWFIQKSGGGASIVQWGTSGDIPVPGDYDGDIKTDIAVWRPSNGYWFIQKSGGGISIAQWGASGDIPVPGKYDSDNKTDIAVWRPSSGHWFIQKSSGGVDVIQYGTIGDIPTPGDYDGNGSTDIAVFRPSNGYWFVRGQMVVQWGTSGDVPLVR